MRADCITSPASPKRVLITLLTGLALAGLALLIDAPVATFCQRFQPAGDLHLGGDLKRTLEWLQQFGDIATCIIIALCIWLLDPANRRNLWRALLALLASGLAVQALKMFAGRPRPRVVFGHPKPGYDAVVQFTGPLREYPLPRTSASGLTEYASRHAWEFWNHIGSDLWSFPSSHTSAAAGLAVILARLYPPLRPLLWTLVAIVGTSRVLLGAHFPSDVIAGAAIGYAFTALLFRLSPPQTSNRTLASG
jgi:membrane-associated phospholipid phosphatase